MTTMTTNILTSNYREYIKLQLELQRAIYRNKLEPCPERVKSLIEAVQDPATRLSEYERDYAEWVLDLYHPETGLNIKQLKDHIKEVAKLDREYKDTMKNFHRKKASWEDLSKVNRKFREYPLMTSQMCAIRAAMRGRLHMHKSLEEQRGWIENFVEDYRREA